MEHGCPALRSRLGGPLAVPWGKRWWLQVLLREPVPRLLLGRLGRQCPCYLLAPTSATWDHPTPGGRPTGLPGGCAPVPQGLALRSVFWGCGDPVSPGSTAPVPPTVRPDPGARSLLCQPGVPARRQAHSEVVFQPLLDPPAGIRQHPEVLPELLTSVPQRHHWGLGGR